MTYRAKNAPDRRVRAAREAQLSPEPVLQNGRFGAVVELVRDQPLSPGLRRSTSTAGNGRVLIL
jgi:hypothetical protein